MPMWRDPLDELIEELELTLPTPPESTQGLIRVEEMIAFADTILYGTEAAKQRLLANPDVFRRLGGSMRKTDLGRGGGKEIVDEGPVRTSTGSRQRAGTLRPEFSGTPHRR